MRDLVRVRRRTRTPFCVARQVVGACMRPRARPSRARIVGGRTMMHLHDPCATVTRSRRRSASRGRSVLALTVLLALAGASGVAQADDPRFPAPTGEASVLPAGAKLDRIFDGGCMLT